MHNVVLTAAPRTAAAGALAHARAQGLLPLTITDMRGKKLLRHALTLTYDAFGTAWRQRTVDQQWDIDGIGDRFTMAVTAFNYCPVSHTVIHVLAVAYTPAQRVVVPVIHHESGAPTPFQVPIVCRGAAPQSIECAQALGTAPLRYADCRPPAGVTVAAHAHDRLDTAYGQLVATDFWQRPGR